MFARVAEIVRGDASPEHGVAFFRDSLQVEGLEVLEAADGLDGLEQARPQRADLVLTSHARSRRHVPSPPNSRC
jgi:hypothetical protein